MTMDTILHNADQKFFSFSLRRLLLREEDLCLLRVRLLRESLSQRVLRLGLLERGMVINLHVVCSLNNKIRQLIGENILI